MREEDVESGQLLVPWKQHKAFLKEEETAERLREHNERHGYSKELPVVAAMEQVFEATGDDIHFCRGVLSGTPEALERVRQRAGVHGSANSAVAYIDRQGRIHLPFDEALELARKFCAAEPSPVLVELEATEREWTHKAQQRGEEYIVPLLNEYRASWAILRQWTRYDAAVAQR